MRARRVPIHFPRRAAAVCLLAASVTVPLLTGCGGKKPRAQGPVPVTVATAELRSVPNSIEATGTVEPIQTVAVQSQISGVLIAVTFREGTDVTEGQVLFRIDPRPFRAALDQAQATLARDRAQAAKAVPDMDRYKDLVAKDYVTQSDYEEKRATAEALLSTVRADSAAVENARLNLEYATIRAPISGRTGALLVHEGNLVRAGGPDPLVVINSLRPIRVRFPIPERSLDELLRARGQHLPVAVFPTSGSGDSIPGVLTFVDNNVDQATGTILCKAEFPNRDGALWPGEFVNARVVLSVDSHVCVIPAQAVTASQSGTVVFVVGEGEKVEARPVTVARSDDEVAVIAKGVSPGERIVTDGQFRLAPGTRVLVKNAAGGGNGKAAGGSGATGGAAGAAGAAGARTGGSAKRS